MGGVAGGESSEFAVDMFNRRRMTALEVASHSMTNR
jgi:hypothetical protein